VINNTQNAKGILTGKFFEYLAAKRPILAIGPVDGDVAAILDETNSGVIVDFNDFWGIENVLKSYYKKYKKQELVLKSQKIENYDRRRLTNSLVELINAL